MLRSNIDVPSLRTAVHNGEQRNQWESSAIGFSLEQLDCFLKLGPRIIHNQAMISQ